MLFLDQFVKRCHSNIVSNKNVEVEDAISYLTERKIQAKTMAIHQIGYCCDGDNIPDEVRFFGYDPSTSAKKKEFDYYIRGNIIVPVYSEFNNLVGFATREPSFKSDRSWWNLAKPFKKGAHLFLLNIVRKSVYKANKIYLVEGYIDAIILHQAGLKNVVAVMGVKLSPRKIALIARYCNNVCICMDTDKNQAGQRGQAKIIYDLRKFDFCDNISVIEGIPVGEDPDEFVSKHGLAEFLKLERVLSETEISTICKQVSKDEKYRS